MRTISLGIRILALMCFLPLKVVQAFEQDVQDLATLDEDSTLSECVRNREDGKKV